MTKQIKQVKPLKIWAIVLAFAVFFAAGSVVYGGLRWTGIDPVLIVDGKQVNIVVYVPTVNCDDGDLTGPIKVEVKVPRRVSVELIRESEGCGTETVTTTMHHRKDTINVAVNVKSKENFPVRVHILVEKMRPVMCKGKKSDNKVSCKADLGKH